MSCYNASTSTINGWFPAVYMSRMSQNFRLFHVSNLSVRNFRIFLLMYTASLRRTEAAGLPASLSPVLMCGEASSGKSVLWSLVGPDSLKLSERHVAKTVPYRGLP